ncbi:MAG TPA: capsule biosynthesis GfcC family protein [Rhodanobacteraceae bacterium]
MKRPLLRHGGMWLAGLAWVLLAAPAWSGDITVTVTGRVAHPGALTLPAGARLNQAIAKADVLPDAYVLGAAWLRPQLHKKQLRWKLAALFDAGVLRGQARLDGRPALLALATRLQRAWQALPVTGRERKALLDLRPLEVSTRNHLLVAGDTIVYPSRPTTVRVVGAVKAPCVLAFVAMRKARVYRQSCPLTASASKDWLYVIEPDGSVSRHGVALWNRDAGQVLAPGAVVYVPLARSVLPKAVRDSFNTDAVRFLSTQVLPVTGDSP